MISLPGVARPRRTDGAAGAPGSRSPTEKSEKTVPLPSIAPPPIRVAVLARYATLRDPVPLGPSQRSAPFPLPEAACESWPDLAVERALGVALGVARVPEVLTVAPAGQLRGGAGATRVGRLIEEPGDRGSVGSLLVALSHVIEASGDAALVVVPARRAEGTPEALLRRLRHALDVVRRTGRRAIVLIRGDAPGAADPSPVMGIVGGADRLWRTVARAMPDWTRRFDVLRRVLRAVREGRAPLEHARLALAHIYMVDERADLEAAFLGRAEVTVLSLESRGASGTRLAACRRAESHSRAMG